MLRAERKPRVRSLLRRLNGLCFGWIGGGEACRAVLLLQRVCYSQPVSAAIALLASISGPRDLKTRTSKYRETARHEDYGTAAVLGKRDASEGPNQEKTAVNQNAK